MKPSATADGVIGAGVKHTVACAWQYSQGYG